MREESVRAFVGPLSRARRVCVPAYGCPRSLAKTVHSSNWIKIVPTLYKYLFACMFLKKKKNEDT